MALQPCTECQTQVSDKAVSCPQCGAPVLVVPQPKVKQKATAKDFFVALGFLALCAIIWKSCSSDPEPKKDAYVAPAVASATASTPTAPQVRPEVPALPMPHNYSLKENGEYGYEQALSDDDKKAGITTKPLVMAKYLGEKNGTISVVIQDGGKKTLFSCTLPCDFVKVGVFFGNEIVDAQRVKNTDGSIMNGILQDAMLDQLEVYKPTGKKHQAKIAEE